MLNTQGIKLIISSLENFITSHVIELDPAKWS